MTNNHGNLAAQDLVVTEVGQPYEVTEEDLTLVAVATTCTCSIGFDIAAAEASSGDAADS